ncbi:hypothetical protein [Lentzea sp.]|uniref:hypothetical protein n=1 Tax=Lentzea sp. TaxID=56099 RepID=UPI002C6464BC|nr:hypothetical protein [Lentzea sp.]HUQ60184.1 hypothetical protein [Lentzea sp.]
MSEQGPTPPPQEPSSNDPRVARPAPEQATTPLPADAPATPGQQPTVRQPTAPQPTAAQPEAAPQHPAAEHPAAAPPPPAAAAPVAVAPAAPGRVRRFAGHRATQLVAVGLLGLVLGGGIVGAATRFDHRGGPGHVRMHERGDRGPDRGGDRSDRRGPFGDRGDRGDRFER